MFLAALNELLGDQTDPVAAGWQLRQLTEGAAGQGPELVEQLAELSEPLAVSDPAIVGALLRSVSTIVLRDGESALRQIDPDWIVAIEAALPAGTSNRALLLQLLALIRSETSLPALIRLCRQQAPGDWTAGAQIISPLMQHDDWPVEAFFPAALDCIDAPALAAPLLDLANYLVRTRRVTDHPARERLAMLNSLLGAVSGRLGLFEENPHAFGDDVETVHRTLGEAVALAVSLCDTLGMIGDQSSIGKLYQTLDLKHRRVQCEAAGALARMGEELGHERLQQLTAEPAARLRAIHYLDELDCGDRVPPRYRGDQATAEAELALWLSQPTQMGLPPTAIEAIDSQRLMWPGFHDPMDVCLVRFEYSFGDQTYSNVGITGPVTFAMGSDVANLPTADIYAIYAGWHVEHDEIFAVAADQFNQAQIRIMGTYQKYLSQQGYDSLRAELFCLFLDEQSGVFSAVRDDTACVVITDGLETIEQVVAGRVRPLTPHDLFNLYKGRKMLRTFNADRDLEI
jgi:hypothetical protein